MNRKYRKENRKKGWCGKIKGLDSMNVQQIVVAPATVDAAVTSTSR